MSKEQLMIYSASVLGTLSELPEGHAPQSPLYLAIGCSINTWTELIYIWKKAGWITATSETITLTPAGREIGKRCNEVAERRKNAC